MTISVEEAEKQARALLDARIESVRALVTARQQVSDLRDQLAAAEREDARLYAAALRDGWSTDELRKLGLNEPGKPARAVRRRTTKTPAATPPADAAASA